MDDANAREDDGWVSLPEMRGGCQCGAIHYRIAPGRAFASICHCRMCQRATGGPFAALLKVAEDRVTWLGTPAVFRSSNIAERGFCPACGTPLFYRAIGSGMIELTQGSLAPEVPFVPVRQWGVEGRQRWLDGLDIPGARTTERDVIPRQAPE